MENPNDQRLSFSFPGETTIVDVISDILLNNGFGETPEESFEKVTRGKPSSSVIIKDAAKNLAEKKVTENDLISSLQNQLGAKKETAAKMVAEIKEKILPFAKIISDSQPSQPAPEIPKETDTFTKIKAPIGIEEILAKPQTNQAPIVPSEESLTKIERAKDRLKKESAIKPSAPTEKESNKPSQSKKQDTYREPIE